MGTSKFRPRPGGQGPVNATGATGRGYMRRNAIVASIIGVAAMLSTAGLAQAQQVKAGVLNCDISAGLGLIIGSQRSVSCVFTPDVPGPQQGYVGTITKFGLDLGDTVAGRMVWGVFTETTRNAGFLA